MLLFSRTICSKIANRPSVSQNVAPQSRKMYVHEILLPVYAPQVEREGPQLVLGHLCHQLLRILVMEPGIHSLQFLRINRGMKWRTCTGLEESMGVKDTLPSFVEGVRLIHPCLACKALHRPLARLPKLARYFGVRCGCSASQSHPLLDLVSYVSREFVQGAEILHPPDADLVASRVPRWGRHEVIEWEPEHLVKPQWIGNRGRDMVDVELQIPLSPVPSHGQYHCVSRRYQPEPEPEILMS